MCDVYNQLSNIYILKNALVFFVLLLPIVFMMSSLRDILKGFINCNISYKKPIKKLFSALFILFIIFGTHKANISMEIKVLNTWNSANIKSIAFLKEECNSSTDILEIPHQEYIEDIYKIDVDQLRQSVENLIVGKDVSVSFYNLNYNEGFHINGDKKYIAASVSKINNILNVYDYAFENNINLKNVYMTYSSSDYQGGSGVLQASPDLKKRRYSLYELCELAIRKSDNIAKNMLARYMYNKRSNTKYYEELVDSDSVIIDGNFAMTANWAVKMMKKIYYNEFNNPYYEKLITDMKNSGRGNISEYLEQNVVAHKMGFLYSGGYLFANGAGIIYSDNDYILAVFTKTNMSVNDASILIGEISFLIYEQISQIR